MKTGPCRACGTPMIWAVTVTGANQPFDPEPNLEAEFLLVKRLPSLANGDAPLALSTSRLGLYADEILSNGAATYMPHHATCPKWQKEGTDG